MVVDQSNVLEITGALLGESIGADISKVILRSHHTSPARSQHLASLPPCLHRLPRLQSLLFSIFTSGFLCTSVHIIPPQPSVINQSIINISWLQRLLHIINVYNVYVGSKRHLYIFGFVKTNSLNCLINKNASPTPTVITKLFQTEWKRTIASIFLSKETVAHQLANELPGHILCATLKLPNSSTKQAESPLHPSLSLVPRFHPV